MASVWFIVLGLLGFLAFLAYLAGVKGFEMWSQYNRTSARVVAYWYTDEGRIKEERKVKPKTPGAAFWKEGEDISNEVSSGYVKFHVYPLGIGRPEPKEWPADDYFEQDFATEQRKVLHFNLLGYDNSLSPELNKTKKLLDKVLYQAKHWKGEFERIDADVEAEVIRRIEVGKKGITIPPMKKPMGKGI